MHHVNAGVIYSPEGKVEDDNLINVPSLQSCYLKPEEIINKEVSYIDGTIHFQPEGQDLQFFLYLSALNFGGKPSHEGKKLRAAQGGTKLLLTESAIYTAWLYKICKSLFSEASNAMCLLG